MASLGPISRRELIARPRSLGFRLPISGAKHQFMLKGNRKVFIPNPHMGANSTGLFAKILKHAGVSHREWENL
jgi:hypothetical protein